MNKLTRSITAAMLFLLLTGCGINSNLINQFTVHGNNTQVTLEKANFKVIGPVRGEASDMKVLGFGGFKSNLVEQAKQAMMANAELNGKSRAVINMGVERHNAFYLLASKLTVVVSGTVIEFEE